MKKTILVILTLMIIATLCATFIGCKSNEDLGVNILSNPTFDETSESSKIVDWVVSSSSVVKPKKNTYGDDDYDPKLGVYYFSFNVSSAYEYATQSIALKKNSTYMLTALVKITSVSATDGIGFRFGFETEGDEFSGLNITETNDEWKTVTYYFATSEKVDAAKFTIGVGSPSKTASAVGYVDNISISRVNEVPQEYLENHEVEVLKYSTSTDFSDAGSICFVVFMSLASLCIASLVYFLIARSLKPSEKPLYQEEKKHSDLYNKINAKIDLEKVRKALTSDFAIFGYIIFGSLLVRFVVAVCTFGMSSNINDLETMAQLGKSSGLLSFYSNNAAQTYPLGGVVTYTVLANVAAWLKIKSASLGYAILMRLPQILADIVVTYMIYLFVATNKDMKQAAIYSGFYAFIPLFFFFGSFMGAMESVAIMFLVAMGLSILKKDYILTPILYMCALSFSHYVLVIFPVILAFQVYGMIKDADSRMMNIISVAVCFILFYLFGFIMTFESVKSGKVFVYFERLYQFFKDNAYLSTDSLSMYSIFGAANSKVRSTIVEVFNWIFVAAMSAWPIFIYIKNKNRLDLLLNAGLMFIAYALIGAGATIDIMPLGLILVLMYIAIVPEARLFLCYSVLATLSFMNMAQLASQSGYITSITSAAYTAFSNTSAFLITFSIFAVVALFYMIYVSIDVTYFNQASEIEPLDKNFAKQIKNMFIKGKSAKKTK